MKKIVIFSLTLLSIVSIVGCSKKETKENQNKIYECKYTNKDEGRQTISEKRIEVDKDEKPIFYEFTYGFSNYGDKTETYESACKNIEEAMKNEKIVSHKDSVTVKKVCNEKNNKQVYMIAKYDLNKLQGDEDFKAIVEYVQKYTKEDGTFDKESFKKSFDDEQHKGKYTCNY